MEKQRTVSEEMRIYYSFGDFTCNAKEREREREREKGRVRNRRVEMW